EAHRAPVGGGIGIEQADDLGDGGERLLAGLRRLAAGRHGGVTLMYRRMLSEHGVSDGDPSDEREQNDGEHSVHAGLLASCSVRAICGGPAAAAYDLGHALVAFPARDSPRASAASPARSRITTRLPARSMVPARSSCASARATSSRTVPRRAASWAWVSSR